LWRRVTSPILRVRANFCQFALVNCDVSSCRIRTSKTEYLHGPTKRRKDLKRRFQSGHFRFVMPVAPFLHARLSVGTELAHALLSKRIPPKLPPQQSLLLNGFLTLPS